MRPGGGGNEAYRARGVMTGFISNPLACVSSTVKKHPICLFIIHVLTVWSRTKVVPEPDFVDNHLRSPTFFPMLGPFFRRIFFGCTCT